MVLLHGRDEVEVPVPGGVDGVGLERQGGGQVEKNQRGQPPPDVDRGFTLGQVPGEQVRKEPQQQGAPEHRRRVAAQEVEEGGEDPAHGEEAGGGGCGVAALLHEAGGDGAGGDAAGQGEQQRGQEQVVPQALVEAVEPEHGSDQDEPVERAGGAGAGAVVAGGREPGAGEVRQPGPQPGACRVAEHVAVLAVPAGEVELGELDEKAQARGQGQLRQEEACGPLFAQQPEEEAQGQEEDHVAAGVGEAGLPAEVARGGPGEVEGREGEDQRGPDHQQGEGCEERTSAVSGRFHSTGWFDVRPGGGPSTNRLDPPAVGAAPPPRIF